MPYQYKANGHYEAVSGHPSDYALGLLEDRWVPGSDGRWPMETDPDYCVPCGGIHFKPTRYTIDGFACASRHPDLLREKAVLDRAAEVGLNWRDDFKEIQRRVRDLDGALAFIARTPGGT